MSVDWLLESTPYNEWLNEEDYQLEENGKVCKELGQKNKYLALHTGSCALNGKMLHSGLLKISVFPYFLSGVQSLPLFNLT